ncbi:MAG: hypothetical protein WBA16_02755, partial [Nonlabens sp.]
MWTEGWKAKTTENTETQNNINNNPQDPNALGLYRGQVTVNLFCTNYAGHVPIGCSCNKPIRLFYRYDTQ